MQYVRLFSENETVIWDIDLVECLVHWGSMHTERLIDKLHYLLSLSLQLELVY
jgi:hypothetical protein